MSTNVFDGDVIVRGNLSAQGFTVPAGAVSNSQVASNAAIDTSKLNHRHHLTFAQSGNAASATIPIFRCKGTTGTIQEINAGSIAAAVGAATVTIDLKKNGTTVLSSVITLDNGNSARVTEAGTLSVTTMTTGDFLELVVTATAGGGTLPTGLLVDVVVDETAV